jgi:hypothetical protein
MEEDGVFILDDCGGEESETDIFAPDREEDVGAEGDDNDDIFFNPSLLATLSESDGGG